MTAQDQERRFKGYWLSLHGAIHKSPHNIFWVMSPTQDIMYRVNPTAKTCGCPDHKYRNSFCKHLHAIKFLRGK